MAAKEVISAKVIGKSQNRTALGLMHAYLKMYPDTTLSELQTQFPKQKICPDAAGITFYSVDELEKKGGETPKWYFTESDELLTLNNGEKVAFTNVWSASSLQLLQEEMAKHKIAGEVDKSCKTARGFSISCEYQVANKIVDSAEFEFVVIERDDNNRITVRFSNTKDTLRKISKKAGFQYDESWNTQSFGRELIKFLNGQK